MLITNNYMVWLYLTIISKILKKYILLKDQKNVRNFGSVILEFLMWTKAKWLSDCANNRARQHSIAFSVDITFLKASHERRLRIWNFSRFSRHNAMKPVVFDCRCFPAIEAYCSFNQFAVTVLVDSGIQIYYIS